MCIGHDNLVCAGRRPTTGSRQKYSAAKTEVASESLPVAPFARPALPAYFISLALMSLQVNCSVAEYSRSSWSYVQ